MHDEECQSCADNPFKLPPMTQKAKSQKPRLASSLTVSRQTLETLAYSLLPTFIMTKDQQHSASSSARSVAPPPELHFDDGSRIMTEQPALAATTTSVSPRGSTPIEMYYEIDRLSQEIQMFSTTGDDDYACRVALQFPDELLVDAPDVCWAMERALPNNNYLVFILGDTTFGSCCPDEVSALHLNANVLIHYGHACLSPAASLPVLYSFGRTDVSINVDTILQQVAMDSVENMLLLYQVRYHHAMQPFNEELQERGSLKNVLVGQVPQPCSEPTCCSDAGKEEPTTGTFVVGGLELPSDVDLSTFTLVFIGDDNSSSRQYVNVMLRFMSMHNGPSHYWTYSPMTGELTTTLPPFLQRRLNRRFYLTQKARDAQVYGILVGTLSQQHFTSVVSTLQRIIADAGKSSYTFAVGKINGAKLANFGEIDCFVLVACGEHSLLDNERDLHVPVITPLELDIALGNAEWGFYSLNYSEFLRRKEGETGAVTEEDADAPYYSLISGKYIDSKKEELDLSSLPGKGQIAAYKSEASNHLRNREYQGLEANIGKDEAHKAVPGQTGIASDYGNR